MSRDEFRNSAKPLGNQIDLNFYYCGKEVCEPDHSWGPGIRDHYTFVYIHQGRGLLRVGDEAYSLSQNQGFVVFPNTITYFIADHRDPWIYSWVAFHGRLAESYVRRARLNSTEPVITVAENSCIETMFDQLMDARQTERSRDLKYQGILYRLLAELIDLSAADLHSGADRKHWEAYVRQAMEFIEKNYSHKFSISELAEVIGVDRKYLSTLFKKTVSLSPQAFLLQFRMNKACEMMSNWDLSIANISRSVGYDDPLLFSKMFKKVIGISPREYRKRS